MPQIIPAVVAAIAYVGTATTAVLAGTATLAQIATVAAVGIGAGVGGMAAAKALTPEIGSQGASVRWEANPDAPLRFAFGRVGVKGSIIDAGIYGADRMYVSFACTVSAAGPIKRFVTFRAGDHIMSFDGAGNALNEPYRGEMWLSTRLGTQPDTALSLPAGLKNGVTFPGWGAHRKMSGSAAYLVTLGENSKRSAYDGKVPAFVAVIEGLFCYDPRLDSTYPGGSGPCRLNDPSTWVWTQNPILFALKWALGLWEGPVGKGAPQVDYQVGGIGAKVESIRLTTAVEAANIADANGWTSAAWPSTDDDKAQVLDGFLKAGGARYAEIAGQMAFIHRAAPRAPVFTVRARDTAGPIEIDTASSKLNRINTVRPRYWSEAHEWEMTALPEVTSTVWQTEDGQGVPVKRTRGADFTFVPDPKQARELASLEISNSREGIKGRVPLRPYMDPEPGNTFIFDEPDFALSNVKCFVLDVEDDTENDTVVVTFETETDGKYPYAYGQTPSPPPAQELDPYDPTLVSPPLPDDWVITPRPPGPGGTLVPGFDLSGVVGNSTATAIEVQWWVVPDGVDPIDQPPEEADWQSAGTWPPTATTIPINVQGNRYYWIGLIYIRGQNYSTRTAIGPWLAGKLIAGGLAPDAAQELLDEATKEVNDKVKEATDALEAALDLDGLFDGQDDLAEAILKLGRGVTELQRVTETNTRDGGKLVKSIVRVMGGELDNAQGAIVQEAALSLQRDQAEAIIRQALALQVDQNRASAESSISALVSDLAAEVSARTALGARVGATESAISSEATVRASETGGLATTLSLLGVRNGGSTGFILNQSTVQWGAEGTLASVLSGLRAADGANSSSLISLQSASSSQASQLTTLSSTVGGHTSSISSLLSTTAGLGARWTLAIDTNGVATTLVADGASRSLVFGGSRFAVIDDGNGLSYEPATGRMKIVRGTKKTVLGAGGGLILWAGNTSIGDGFETVDNGDLGIGSGDAWFGGRTLSGPFDSGPPSGSPIALPKNTWTTVATVAARSMAAEGDLMARFDFEVLVNGAPDEVNDYGVLYRIAVANADGSGAVNVVDNFGGGTPNAWLATGGFLEGHVSTTRGTKRLLLQVNPTGSTITTASARNGRLRGLYGA